MAKWWSEYQVNVPVGTLGHWRVERFSVSEEEAARERLRAFCSRDGRCVPVGEYTRLMRGRAIVMSDTPDEIRDHLRPIHKATGQCLVNGLGLGVVVQAMLANDRVECVTVVEKSLEVIALVGVYYEAVFGSRLSLVHGDAFTWKPPRCTRYSVVWHDIWDTICLDNLPEMATLHRRYGRRCDWQGSWCRELLQSLRRRGR